MQPGTFITISPLVMIPNSKGEWISTGDTLFFSPHLGEVLRVPPESINNLASIPRFARSLFPVNGPSRPAAQVHDYLYEKRGKDIELADGSKLGNLSRKDADIVFMEALMAGRGDYFVALPLSIRLALEKQGRDKYFVLGDNKHKSLAPLHQQWVMYSAVRAGGGFAWRT